MFVLCPVRIKHKFNNNKYLLKIWKLDIEWISQLKIYYPNKKGNKYMGRHSVLVQLETLLSYKKSTKPSEVRYSEYGLANLEDATFFRIVLDPLLLSFL